MDGGVNGWMWDFIHCWFVWMRERVFGIPMDALPWGEVVPSDLDRWMGRRGGGGGGGDESI